MNRAITFKNHPFRFLLYLEWILLIIAMIAEVIPERNEQILHWSLLTNVSLTGFGIMGLRMPTNKLIYKVLYTSLEILLILLTAVSGSKSIRLFPFLYLILVTRSCLIFQVSGRLIITSLSFTLFLLTSMSRFRKIATSPAAQERLFFIQLVLVLLFGLSLVFVLLLMNVVLSERQSREKLAKANDQLRQYALRIENQATLQERNRIAREIHDSLGHSLTALNLQLETALKLWSTDQKRAVEFMERAKKLGSKALQDVRNSVSAMRSDPLQGHSLKVAITTLAEEFHRSTGILPNCNIELNEIVTTDVGTAVYRIVQEALTNITRYAQANQVDIQVVTRATSLLVKIQDNGQGFNLDQNTTGFGLQSMRDRTLSLGGKFQIDSLPNQGCCVTAHIPLARLPQ